MIEKRKKILDIIQKLETEFGVISEEEVCFYKESMYKKNNVLSTNSVQLGLIKGLCSKYFNEANLFNFITQKHYIKLLIISKKMLLKHNAIFLPYIISSNMDELPNKEEFERIKKSEFYAFLVDRYRGEVIANSLSKYLATIKVSKFSIIDFQNKELHNKIMEIDLDILENELLLYTTMF